MGHNKPEEGYNHHDYHVQHPYKPHRIEGVEAVAEDQDQVVEPKGSTNNSDHRKKLAVLDAADSEGSDVGQVDQKEWRHKLVKSGSDKNGATIDHDE